MEPEHEDALCRALEIAPSCLRSWGEEDVADAIGEVGMRFALPHQWLVIERDPSRFVRRFLRAVRNLLIDVDRRRRRFAQIRREKLEPDFDRRSSPSSDTETGDVESVHAVRSALRDVEHQPRVALWLRYYEEIPLRGIAELLDLKNPQAADRLLEDGLLFLRRQPELSEISLSAICASLRARGAEDIGIDPYTLRPLEGRMPGGRS